MTTPVISAPAHDSALAETLRTFCLEDYDPPRSELRQALPRNEIWQRLAATGTSLWLDTGDVDAIAKLWTREFVALTTNNTLLNREVQKGIHDELVPRAAKLLADTDPGMSKEMVVQEVAFILNAVHGLMLVSRFDADVSVELHTSLARDTEASYRYGKRFAAICPDRFIVKVPLTPEGLFAARRLGQDGIRVNFTLGFSARENYLIAATARPAFVNVFMGRCNALVAGAKLGDGHNVGEKATLASQRGVRRICSDLRISVRQIGASMRSGAQAIDLAGLDVFTLPTAVAAEVQDLAPSAEDLRDRTAEDPEVTLAQGHDIQEERLGVFWDVEDGLEKAVSALQGELEGMNGADLRTFLSDHGVIDLFGELSGDDRARIAADGKIPQYEPWAQRVKAGTLAWDALLTESGLASFAADQAKLDARIRSLL